MIEIIKPYGEQDPYALVELIASTVVHSEAFDVDEMPALAARVSHANAGKTGENTDDDKKLMRYLATHKHMTPFEHQSATFKIVAPIFVVREWHRHRTQAYNEMSMRYTANPVGKLFKPEEWREQCDRNKQGSAKPLKGYHQASADIILKKAYKTAIDSYESLLNIGVCREQARIVVPVGNYTEFYATASLRNWYGFYALRHDLTAQKEIRDYADAIDLMLTQIWPASWGVLKDSLGG